MPTPPHYCIHYFDSQPQPWSGDEAQAIDKWIEIYIDYLSRVRQPNLQVFSNLKETFKSVRMRQLRYSRMNGLKDAFPYNRERWAAMQAAILAEETLFEEESPLWKTPTREQIAEGRLGLQRLRVLETKYGSLLGSNLHGGLSTLGENLDLMEATLEGLRLPTPDYLRSQILQLKSHNQAWIGTIPGTDPENKNVNIPVIAVPLAARDCETSGDGPDHYFAGGVLVLHPCSESPYPPSLVWIQPLHNRGWDGLHPHINSEGSVCWGDAGPTLIACASQGDLIPLVYLVDSQFIGYYNWDTAFWNPDDDEGYEEDEEYEEPPLEELIPF